MGSLNSAAAWGASAGLILVSLIPLGTLWGINLRRSAGPRSEPVRLAHAFLCSALPVLIIAVVLAAYSPIITAVSFRRSLGSSARNAFKAALYTAFTSQFAVTAAAILTTCAVYLGCLSVVYLARGRKKWWRLLRLDVFCGAFIFLALDIAWWATNLAAIQNHGYSFPVNWLAIIVDIALCFLAAVIVGLALYATPKLKQRPDVVVGNIPVLLISASILWLLRCTFILAVDLKTHFWAWTDDEADVQKFLAPILDLWVSATVIGLATGILRHPVWLDPRSIPEHPATQPQPPQYGYQQQQQPGMYQQYPQYPPMQQPQYPQYPPMQQPHYQQGYYAPQPELAPGPVPATRA